MNENDLAPIGLSVYIRLEHIKETVEALKKNTLAESSELYIFSDAPRKGDEEKVKIVRDYLKTIDGFKSITIFERKNNSRVINNRSGIKYLLDNYGKMIFLEEDIVTASGFLKFINGALEFYKDDETISCVSGFTPINHEIQQDFYITPRYSGWGVGFWKDKYILITDLPKYENIRNDKKTYVALKKMGGDMLKMVKAESRKKIDALDIKACYFCAKENKYNILPSKTLVKNIGLDGSGLHCGVSSKYDDNSLSTKTDFNFDDRPTINRNVLNDNFKHYRTYFGLTRVISALKNIYYIKRNYMQTSENL